MKCANCGSPKEDDEKYRMPGTRAPSITDAKQLADAHAGANWTCASCGDDNRAAREATRRLAQIVDSTLLPNGYRSSRSDVRRFVRHDLKAPLRGIGQLATWAERAGVDIVRGPEGGDPASIVFDAVKQATDTGIDALVVDTAGRLQNKKELMEELAKIRRVLGRLNEEAPHDVVLVLDATNGQNALSQIDVFQEVAGVTGLIMTKLDGTARGGVLVAAAEQYGLPIHAIGVGEKMEDLRPFDPDLVARVIAGVA